jgi:hypothetical protein
MLFPLTMEEREADQEPEQCQDCAA